MLFVLDTNKFMLKNMLHDVKFLVNFVVKVAYASAFV